MLDEVRIATLLSLTAYRLGDLASSSLRVDLRCRGVAVSVSCGLAARPRLAGTLEAAAREGPRMLALGTEVEVAEGALEGDGGMAGYTR